MGGGLSPGMVKSPTGQRCRGEREVSVGKHLYLRNGQKKRSSRKGQGEAMREKKGGD